MFFFMQNTVLGNVALSSLRCSSVALSSPRRSYNKMGKSKKRRRYWSFFFFSYRIPWLGNIALSSHRHSSVGLSTPKMFLYISKYLKYSVFIPLTQLLPSGFEHPPARYMPVRRQPHYHPGHWCRYEAFYFTCLSISHVSVYLFKVHKRPTMKVRTNL